MSKEPREFQSVKKWFTLGNHGKGYTTTTQRVHLRYLGAWLRIANMNPDQLANCENIDEMRGRIAVGLYGLIRVESITKRINALNEFWRCNGRTIAENVYEGIDRANPELGRSIMKFRKTMTSQPEQSSAGSATVV